MAFDAEKLDHLRTKGELERLEKKLRMTEESINELESKERVSSVKKLSVVRYRNLNVST